MVAQILRGCLSSQHDEKFPSKTVVQVFKEASGGKDLMTGADVISFLNSQGDEKLTPEQAQNFLGKGSSGSSRHFFSQHHHHGDSSPGLDLAGFTKLLLNPNLNCVLKPSQRSQDMTAPLSYYYVHTSHNTYLTGNQLTSKCSTTPIINALLKGCRVIELDCWERGGKIKVLHGGTLTRAVKFEDCIQSIKENAFKSSDYPVILTIENHLKPELQIEAARIMKAVFGDLLFLPNEDERPPLEFHSPEKLKGKIIVSDKPLRQPVGAQLADDPDDAVDDTGDFTMGNESPDARPARRRMFPGPHRKAVAKGAQALDQDTPVEPKAKEFEDLLYIYCQKPSEMQEKQTAGGPLVSGDRAIMANLSEPQLKKFLKDHPGSVIEYTKTNMGRVYPYGLRFDSSNADPMQSWSHGCQLAALNLQGQDRPSWLGTGFFRSNGGCGYVRKPEIFLPGSTLGSQDILELQPKLRLKVKVLLGTDWHKRFDYFKHPDFYVKVAVHGIASDNKKMKTKVIRSNKEPSWEDEEFEFPIRVPEIALLRFEVWEEDRAHRDDFVGQFVLPVTQLRQGIRVVPLLSRKGVERSSKLLCQISLEDISSSVVNGGEK